MDQWQESRGVLDALGQCPLFRGMDAAVVSALLQREPCVLTRYGRGELIAVSGQPCRAALVVISGVLSCRMSSPGGREVEMSKLRTGDLVAPAFIFASNNAMPVTVAAHTDVVLLRWGRDSFARLLEGDTTLRARFITVLSDTNVFLTRRLNVLALMTVREKVASLLLMRAREQQSRHVRLSRSRQEIADSFGIQKFSLMRVLADFEREGAIKINGREVTILDSSKLK